MKNEAKENLYTIVITLYILHLLMPGIYNLNIYILRLFTFQCEIYNEVKILNAYVND